MPQGTDYFRDTKEAMRMFIPLVINQRNIEAQAADRERQLDIMRQQHEAQTLQEIAKQKQAEKQAQDKLLVDMFTKAQELGATDYAQQLAPMVEQRTGLQLPKYFSAPDGRELYNLLPKKQKDPVYDLKDTDQGIMAFDKSNPTAPPIPTGMKSRPQKWEIYPPQATLRDAGPPSGYRFKQDGTLEPIPGGPADARNAKQDTMVDRRRVTDERALRKDFMGLPEVKTFTEVKSQFNRLDEAMAEARKGENMVAVDQALITILNKMLDPSSVVRESEYARTPQDLALWNRLKGKVAKWTEGGAGLTNEDREAIATMARKFYEVAHGMYNEQVNYFTDLANDYGYAPENIVRLGGAKGEYQGRAKSPNGPKYKQDFTDADSYLNKKFGGQ